MGFNSGFKGLKEENVNMTAEIKGSDGKSHKH